MRAICLDQNGVHFRHDHPLPSLADNEVSVAVTKAGICETDLQLARGYMGFKGILGHEFVGHASTGKYRGQRVVGEINCNCRDCARCKSNLGNHCNNRTVIGILNHDGAFAEHIAVPETNLHVVPDTVSDDQAVLIEPLAAALQISTQVDLAKFRNALILGDGRLANLCAQVIAPEVTNLTVVGKHESKLKRFNELGMKTQLLSELNCEKAFDLVVDCTGSETGLALALELIQPRGTIVLKTTVAGQHKLSLAPIVIDEINLVGSRCGPFDLAIKKLGTGCFNLDGMITHRFPLQDVEQAFAAAVDPNAFKVVFEISESL